MRSITTAGLIKVGLIKAGLLLAATLATPALLAAVPTAGLYEITVKIENPTIGLSQTQSSKECISKTEFEAGPEAFMSQQQEDSECTMQEYSMENGKITMNMSCVIPGGGKAVVRGTGEYSSDKFSMTNKMSMEAAGMKMDMQTVASGKRIGDC